MVFKAKDFWQKYRHKVKGIKILISKQMIQILPIALAQVKKCNTSENLLNEII